MKTIIMLLVAGIIQTACLAQNKTNVEPYLTKSLAADNISSIDIKTSGGSITVKGGNAATARVEVFVRANNGKDNELSKEEVTERLEEYYTLDVKVTNNKLEALAKPKKQNMDWKLSLSISFVVYAPQKVSTDLATSGGSINLSNLSGALNFSTSGGSLTLDNLSGNVKGRTSGGSINVKNSKDELDLATSGGSILASNCTGNIKLGTSGGSVNLNDLNGIISANTSGGSIKAQNISGELKSFTSGGSINMSDMMCSLETSTSGGQITVAVKQFGKYLKIHNSGGDINLSLPDNKGLDLDLSARKVNAGTVKNFNGRMNDDEIKGSLNGGGIPVSVHAGSGRINLSLN